MKPQGFPEFWTGHGPARVANETNESPKGIVSLLKTVASATVFLLPGISAGLTAVRVRVDVTDLVALRQTVEVPELIQAFAVVA